MASAKGVSARSAVWLRLLQHGRQCRKVGGYEIRRVDWKPPNDAWSSEKRPRDTHRTSPDDVPIVGRHHEHRAGIYGEDLCGVQIHQRIWFESADLVHRDGSLEKLSDPGVAQLCGDRVGGAVRQGGEAVATFP